VYLEIIMFVCIDKELNQVTSVLPYNPNVPDNIEVIEITAEEDQLIKNRSHYFDIGTKTVESLPQHDLNNQQIEKDNIIHMEFLSSTDWKILRHLRQLSLKIDTTLTEAEFTMLENDRQVAAESIIKI
jgi:hypothetical protein